MIPKKQIDWVQYQAKFEEIPKVPNIMKSQPPYFRGVAHLGENFQYKIGFLLAFVTVVFSLNYCY